MRYLLVFSLFLNLALAIFLWRSREKAGYALQEFPVAPGQVDGMDYSWPGIEINPGGTIQPARPAPEFVWIDEFDLPEGESVFEPVGDVPPPLMWPRWPLAPESNQELGPDLENRDPGSGQHRGTRVTGLMRPNPA